MELDSGMEWKLDELLTEILIKSKISTWKHDKDISAITLYFINTLKEGGKAQQLN